MKAVAESTRGMAVPTVVMDTAPAAVLGATYDVRAVACERKIIVNVGNFHTLAFRLGPGGVEGLFEHHTGMLNRSKIERWIRALGKRFPLT